MYKSCTECVNMTRLRAEFGEVMQRIVRSLLRLHGIPLHDVQMRVKGVDSFRIKCVSKREERMFYRQIRQVPDLVGLRICLCYASDTAPVTALLKKEFRIHEERDVEKQYSDRQSVGYRARHLVLSLNSKRVAMPEYTQFQDLRCEVQITTLLEQAWSGIEHELLYKRKEELSEEERKNLERAFASIAQELRAVDRKLDELRGSRISPLRRLIRRALPRG